MHHRTFEIKEDVLGSVPMKRLVVRKHILVGRLNSPLQFIYPSHTHTTATFYTVFQ